MRRRRRLDLDHPVHLFCGGMLEYSSMHASTKGMVS
jgi:hypothetical protein